MWSQMTTVYAKWYEISLLNKQWYDLCIIADNNFTYSSAKFNILPIFFFCVITKQHHINVLQDYKMKMEKH